MTKDKDSGSSEIVSIILVDMAGFTSRTAVSNRKRIMKIQELLDNICLPIFDRFNCEVIKKLGDSFLATCKSATDAVLTGIELQRAFGYYNKGRTKNEIINIRVVVHTGEIIRINGDIYGDAVNTAARVENIAKENHVVFTGSTYLAMNKREFPYIHI